MSAQWTSTELRTTSLRLVRAQVTYDVIRRKHQRVALRQMIKPVMVAAAVSVGFLMQSAGIQWDQVVSGLVGSILALGGVAIKEYWSHRRDTGRLKAVSEGQVHRTSEAIAELDLEERKRIDAKQEQFIEMVRELHTQQTQNMQSIIENQKAIIENQKEQMKLKDIELDRRGVQISDMQNKMLKLT
jgi:hypothetical protein